ncbi:MAG: hypothetical protein ACT4OS_10640, partial [Acidimicrobiales bacterium]
MARASGLAAALALGLAVAGTVPAGAQELAGPSCRGSHQKAAVSCSGARLNGRLLPKPAPPGPPPKQIRKAPKVQGFRVLRAAVDARGGVCLYQRWIPMPAGTGVAHDPWHLSLLGI